MEVGYTKETKIYLVQICVNLIFKCKGEKENELSGILNGEKLLVGEEYNRK